MRLRLADLLTHPLPEPRWIVEDILPEKQISLLLGLPGVGKSYLCYHMAISIVMGMDWLGHRTTPGTVLYFDEENGELDAHTYLHWAWKGLGRPDVDRVAAHLIIEHESLKAANPWPAMLGYAREVRPTLIILDTTTTVMKIKDENDNAIATDSFSHVKGLRDAADNNTAILLLMHEKFVEAGYTRTNRGAKSWLANVSSVMYHKAQPYEKQGAELRPTRLEPDKRRCAGLRYPIAIEAHWTHEDKGERGLALTRGS